MSVIQAIEQKLQAHFSPLFLKLGDDSAKHAGHAGATGGVSHVSIVVVSERFHGMSRVARSRAVHEVLRDEIRVIHAITLLKTLTPDEYRAAGAS